MQIHELFMQIVYASATILRASSGIAEFISLNAGYAKQLLQGMMIQYSPSQSIPELINHNRLELAPCKVT